MARELRRLLIGPERLPTHGRGLLLEPPERHYLTRVLRLRPGDRFALTDGAGGLWTACLSAAGADLEQPPEAPLERSAAPRPPLTLAVAMPRRDGDVLARMACELGIDRLLPMDAHHSSGAERLRPERLAVILREAAEQCERLWLPQLLPLQCAGELLSAPPEGLGLLATTRAAGLPALESVLDQALLEEPTRVHQGVVLAIGPEGGWSPAEEQAATAAGWRAVSLGPTILRVSTAAVAGSAALVRWRLTRS
jgi:16S rRNA (uracil1498-N3)-methyltransferase